MFNMISVYCSAEKHLLFKVSWLIVLLKSSIVWITSLITRYFVTILLTIKIKVRRWYLRLLWPFFELTVCQEFYFSQLLILWVQSVVRALSQAPSMCHISLSYMVTYEMNVSEALTNSKLIDVCPRINTFFTFFPSVFFNLLVSNWQLLLEF